MIDLIFLNALRDKLKGANIRSIHLNNLPGRYASRLDAGSLNHIQQNKAEEFLAILLTKASFEFKISFDGINLNTISSEEQKQLALLSKRLNSLYVENEDNFKEHGIKTFGFGYPILIKPSKLDPTKIIKAPLFIWQLEITKSFNKVNTWSILRNKSRNEAGKIVDSDIHSAGLNEVLLSYLKTDEGISIPQLNEDILEDAIIDKNELISECCKVLDKLNSAVTKDELVSKLNEPIKNIPEAHTIESIVSNNAWIYFGGVFGLYRTQKESIITDIDKLIERYNDFSFESLDVEGFGGVPYSAIETDPSQQEILNTLQLSPRKIIQGPPGTGKSQSLTALITNALANGLKCLVVCEKKTALDVIKNNLHRENERLGALATAIDDVNKDREGIVNSIRSRMLPTSYFQRFGQENYESSILSVEKTATVLNEYHQELAKKIYHGKAWTELVGEYLKRLKRVDYKVLEGKLDYKQFKFEKDDKELIEIVSNIKAAKKLYAEVGRLDHPLELLNNDLFKKDNPRGIKLHIEDLIYRLNRDLTQVKIKIESEISEYSNWLEGHYNEYYEAIKNQVTNYLNFTAKNQEDYGNIFFKNDKLTKLKIASLSGISKRYKTLKNNRVELVKRITDIKQIHSAFKYFEHSFLERDNAPSLEIYVENAKILNQLNENWHLTTKQLKHNYLENVSSSSLHIQFPNKEAISNLELQFEVIIKEIRIENLLQNFIPQTGCLNQELAQISLLLSEFEIISNNLNDFREYYEWKRFYISVSRLQQTIIETIIECKVGEWESAFESWYYYWLLSLNEHKNLPKNDDAIDELFIAKEQLKKNQIANVINSWSYMQHQSIRRSISSGISPISLYNKRGAKGERRNSLRKIIKTDFQLFTDFFPVLMVSPTVCSSIIPLEEGIFDIVIFDEASQLRLEDTFSALLRGKIKIISGDSQQMPPSSYFQGGSSLLNPTDDDFEGETSFVQEIQSRKANNSIELADSESLLVYAENSSYKQSYLRIHYRSQHPYLIDFSNHAFYGKRLIPMPPKRDYIPISFIEVNGTYEDQVNVDEAKQVVDILLNHIKPFGNGKLPSVGIATFNLYQRNLIIDEIYKARQREPEYDKKINDLGSDLFIKNLENIQGDERDIIIISTTFGRKTDGSFRQNFGPILQRNGYKLLNVIITRARFKIFVCSSIPMEHVRQYSSLLSHSKNTGRGVFYAYLAYAKAVSDGNNEIRESILRQLDDNCDSKVYSIEDDIYGSESPFEEEVYYLLASKIGQDRLQQQYRVGGFRIDLIVKSANTGKPIIAIECDGAKYHSSNEAYAWDMFRQKQIEQYGFKFYRIWSTNWFLAVEKELKKVVSFIQNMDIEEKKDIDDDPEPFYITEKITPVTLSIKPNDDL